MWADLQLIDWLLLVVRWLHIVAAVTWLGGGIFLALVVRPLSRNSKAVLEASPLLGMRFKEITDLAIGVLVVTGIVLASARISTSEANNLWFIVFGVKLTLALWIFATLWRLRIVATQNALTTATPSRVTRPSYSLATVLGVTIFFLASLMRLLIEKSG